jgi:predicted O-methyltransferase YrrM
VPPDPVPAGFTETDADPPGTATSPALLDPVVLHAMSWSAEFSVDTVSPETGAILRLLAAATRPRAVVEVGTGLGVSGLWLLAGLGADAVLTTIDRDPDHQAMARQSFAAAGIGPNRTRLITGSARTVLPRLADAAYDLVFFDAPVADAVPAARRLLRPGGLLVVHRMAVQFGPGWLPARLDKDLVAAVSGNE